jgi:hypothetical protein
MADETPPKTIVTIKSTVSADSVSGDAEVVGTKIGELHAQEAHIYEAARPLLTPQERRNRKVMLDKVEQHWVKGVLDQSLYRIARIELGLENSPDSVVNPWESIIQRPEQPDRVVPPEKPIIEVFDELQGSMLILGAPGAGKTTLMLELARDLIGRARTDEAHPMPVIFNLSSWAVARKPLREWLAEELWLRFAVPPKQGRGWLETDALLLLLDGLDEVAAEHRDACVEAINGFEAMVPKVVCSRVKDYETLNAKLRVSGAVVIQPLGEQQVDYYLARLGVSTTGVREVLREGLEWRELLATPLMLEIVVLAFKDHPADELRQVGGAQGLWDAYVQRMYAHRAKSAQCPREKVDDTLQWLAWQMRTHQETVYYIEGMQPTWLPVNQFRTYAAISKSFVLMVNVLGSGFTCFLVASLGFALLGFMEYGQPLGLFIGLASGLFFGLFGLVIGVLFSIVMMLSALSNPDHSRIRLVEKLHFSLGVKPFKAALIAGVAAGSLLLVYDALMGRTLTNAVFYLRILLTGMLIVVLLTGLHYREYITANHPNEGIHTATQNWLTVWLVVGLLNGIIGGLAYSMAHILVLVTSGSWTYDDVLYRFIDWIINLFGWIMLSLIGGLFLGTYYGGRAVLQHITLRYLFERNGTLPFSDRDLIALLDHAASLLFLRRVGGGWIFIHRMLLDHLADKYEAEQNAKTADQ